MGLTHNKRKKRAFENNFDSFGFVARGNGKVDCNKTQDSYRVINKNT